MEPASPTVNVAVKEEKHLVLVLQVGKSQKIVGVIIEIRTFTLWAIIHKIKKSPGPKNS